MALNFPNSPTTGDVHSASNNLSYFFDGVKWISQGSYNTGTINAVKLDSLTSSFNGSLTTFNLTSNNVAVKPANAQSLMISLAGVILEPVTAYTINSAQGTITFASAPASNAAFFGIVYSRLPVEVITTNVSDGVITNAKIASNAAIDQSKLNISDATTSASGFMSTNDKTKLDGIETSATADQTAAEIRTLVENALDSNVFTDADHTKLDSVEAGAKNDQTGSEIKSLYENESDTNAFTDAEKTKLSGIEASATADQTASEIVSLLSNQNISIGALDVGANAAIFGTLTISNSTPTLIFTEDDANPDYKQLAAGGEFVIQNNQGGSYATKFKINADGHIDIAGNLDVGAGLDVTGNIGASGNVTASGFLSSTGGLNTNGDVVIGNDTAKLKLGTSDDLQIYHNGSNSYIDDNGTGNLEIRTVNGTKVTLQGGTDAMLNAIKDGAVQLYYDGALKAETRSDGFEIKQHLTMGDNDEIRLGNSADLKIYHASNVDKIESNGAGMHIRQINNGDVHIHAGADSSASNNRLVARSAGAAELYYSGTKKLETTSGGVTVTGTTTSNYLTLSAVNPSITFTDTNDNPDFKLESNSGQFKIIDTTNSADRLIVQSSGAIDVQSNLTAVSSSSVPALTAKGDGSSQDGYIQLNCSQNSHGVKIKAPPHSAAASYTLTLPDTDGSANQVLKTDGNGNLSWVNQSSGGGGSSIGGATGVDFNDGVKARFGNSNDLEIYHLADTSNVISGAGPLTIQSDDTTSGVSIQTATDGETMAKFIKNGAVELYYDNSKKLETTNTGITVAGNGVFTGNVQINDSAFLNVGNSGDLQIYHNGTDTYIDNTNGELFIKTTTKFNLRSDGNEAMIVATPNGAVELKYDNSTKLQTESWGVDITGTLRADTLKLSDSHKLQLGTSNDLEIYHDGTNSYLVNGASGGILYLQAYGENSLKAHPNGQVELFYDASKKFETTSTGVTVSGDASTGTIIQGAFSLRDTSSSSDRIKWIPNSPYVLRWADNFKASFGFGDDLQIYHDGSNSYIQDSGTGALRIQTNQLDIINAANNEQLAKFVEDGAAELYYNGIKKFETTSTGAKVTGADLTVIGTEGISAGLYLIADEGDDNGDGWRLNSNQDDNDLTIANNISGSYVDKLTLQNDGDLFTTGDVYLKNDSKKLKFGASDDLQIYHDGGDSYIDEVGTGNLHIKSSAIRLRGNSVDLSSYDNNENMLRAFSNGAAELYYDNSKKLETTSSGVSLSGSLNLTGYLLNLGDSSGTTDDRIRLGASADLQIYHDGNHSQIQDTGTGNLQLLTSHFKVLASDGSEEYITAVRDGAVELYYDNSKKIETTNVGISVAGNVDLTAELNLTGGSDAQRYIDAAVGTSALTFRGCTGGDANHQEMARFFRGGGCELNHAGTKKLETASGGVTITGLLTATASNLETGEFGMTSASGTPQNRFMDFGFLNNSLNMRRTNGGEAGHTNFLTVASSLTVSGDLNDTSDEKLKKNIASIADGAIAIIKQLRPVTFDWIDENRNNNVSGFIAQEVKTVLPNLVYGTEYDPTLVNETKGSKGGIKSEGYSVNTVGITAHLTKALQEAIAKIEILETKVATLEAA